MKNGARDRPATSTGSGLASARLDFHGAVKGQAASDLAKPLITETGKRCTHCGEVKPLDSFYPSRARSPNGTQSRCKACNAEVLRSYRAEIKERALRRSEAIRTRVISATILVQR